MLCSGIAVSCIGATLLASSVLHSFSERVAPHTSGGAREGYLGNYPLPFLNITLTLLSKF